VNGWCPLDGHPMSSLHIHLRQGWRAWMCIVRRLAILECQSGLVCMCAMRLQGGGMLAVSVPSRDGLYLQNWRGFSHLRALILLGLFSVAKVPPHDHTFSHAKTE